MAKKDIKIFQLISLPSSFANELYANFLNKVLRHHYIMNHFTRSLLYGSKDLGFFRFIRRFYWAGFFQSAVKEKEKTGQARVIFKSTVKKLSQALPFFAALFFIVEDLFAFVFGENWRVWNLFTNINTYFFLRLISMPVSMINTLFERQIYGLCISIILLVSNMGIILGSIILD